MNINKSIIAFIINPKRTWVACITRWGILLLDFLLNNSWQRLYQVDIDHDYDSLLKSGFNVRKGCPCLWTIFALQKKMCKGESNDGRSYSSSGKKNQINQSMGNLTKANWYTSVRFYEGTHHTDTFGECSGGWSLCESNLSRSINDAFATTCCQVPT